jgi:hypothetical protein
MLDLLNRREIFLKTACPPEYLLFNAPARTITR